ncbi:MAG: alpha/beta hydrolase [Planctomycetes bacterium]|nr:alpha/beta hydrolase [Planctomycetota bacterium]
MPRLAVSLQLALLPLLFAAACAVPATPARAPLPRAAKALPLPGEAFLLAGREAFVLLPAAPAPAPQPWVLYAPTLPGLPSDAEVWLFERLLQRGVAIAGIDVGESYGSAAGARLFDALYDHLVGARGFAPRAALLGRSRGGLMTLAWGADRPERTAAFAGIYPVCDLRSYPGLAKAAPAHGLDEAGLLAALPQHNPIDRLERLARAGVPFFCVHGDVDTLVPLAANSQELLARVRAAGGSAELELLVGRGHNMDPGFFRSERMLAFVLQALGRGEVAR